MAVWLVILAQCTVCAGLVYLAYLLLLAPPVSTPADSTRPGCVDGCAGDVVLRGLLLAGATAVIAGGLVAAPVVDAVLARRDRRDPRRPPPHGPWAAGTRAVGWGLLWGFLGTPLIACLGVGVVKLLSSFSSG